MKKKVVITVMALVIAVLCSCGDKNSMQGSGAATDAAISSEEPTDASPEGEEPAGSTQDQAAQLPDGTYTAEFKSDSSMFHINEACDGKGTLTVENGKMVIHVSLVSKNIVNLYPGLAEDAKKDGADLLMPTEDTVTYSDGWTEVVYGFDVPVPALDTEFDLALIGTKGTWYDHKVSVTNPVPAETEADNAQAAATVESLGLEDGSYTVNAAIEGGTGKASVESPAALKIEDGAAYVTLVWSSPYFDYMKVDGEQYDPINTEGNSVFEIPVSGFDCKLTVSADTTAMSEPHEIEYTLYLESASIEKAE